MKLNAVVKHGDPGRPWLVFLHGFAGDCREWQEVGEQFPAFSRLYLNLPGHGGSVAIRAEIFSALAGSLADSLESYHIPDYWLVGYSMGGRVAMQYACNFRHTGLKGVIVEGAHPGLQDPKAAPARWRADSRWAGRFRNEPLDQVFTDWYQQPVFASLSAEQRQALVALRQKNNGEALAQILLATSLARQEDFRPSLRDSNVPFHYLCGERDSKFMAIAKELDMPCHVIQHAGHNAHRENPAGVVDALAQILRYRPKESL